MLRPAPAGLRGFSADSLNVIQEGAAEGLNPEIYRSQQSVLDAVFLVGVRTHHTPFAIGDCDFADTFEPRRMRQHEVTGWEANE